MDFLGSVPIARKLALVFGGALLLIAAGGLYGIYRLTQANADQEQVLQVEIANERAVVQMLVDFKRQVQEWKDTLLRGKDPELLKKHWGAFQARETDVAQAADKLQHTLPAGDAQRLVAEFGKAHEQMGEHYRSAFETFKAARFDPAVGDAAVKGIDRQPSELLAQAREKIAADAAAATTRSFGEGRTARLASLVLMGLVSALGVLAGALVSRSIVQPINQAVGIAQTVSTGDLTSDIRIQRTDEIGKLLSALRDMNASLATIVGQVRAGANSIATASRQIAAGNQDLSSRTEQQASSLQETAASMEELAATVKQTAENARLANELANAASATAARGGEVVGQVVATMQQITASSQRMTEIINVIDGIAFQTNILALNAAVEAARAGEQGRGFAVVAGEVRNLAQRSAQAAREIKAMIGDSAARVELGSKLVSEAGSSMAEIVIQITRVNDLIAEVTSAALEQSSGLGQINQAVAQMDVATQHNAALVEQSAAAAQSLQAQAASQAEAVSAFRIDQQPALQDPPQPEPESATAAAPVQRPERHKPAAAQAAGRRHDRGGTGVDRMEPPATESTDQAGWQAF